MPLPPIDQQPRDHDNTIFHPSKKHDGVYEDVQLSNTWQGKGAQFYSVYFAFFFEYTKFFVWDVP